MYHQTSAGYKGELNLKMSHDDKYADGQSTTSLEVTTPLPQYDVKVVRAFQGAGQGYLWTASIGSQSMKMEEFISVGAGSPTKVKLLLTATFLEEMLVEYSQDNKLGKFSIKQGPDHLSIDFYYQ